MRSNVAITITIFAIVGLTLQCTRPDQPEPSMPTGPEQPEPSMPPNLGPDGDRFHNKTYLVVNVVDGDTIDIALVDTDPNRTRIRLLGVDTPETKHPRMPVQYFGPEATQYVIEVALGQQIIVQLDPASDIRGKYGRLLAYIQLPDGSILGEQLLARGLAYADTRFPYSKKDRYLDLQRQAMITRAGLWDKVTFEQLPPWLQRANPTLLEEVP